jgi:cell shape-determining protein MreC
MKKTFLARRNALLTSANFSAGGVALAMVGIALLVRFFAPSAFWYVFAPVFSGADSLAARSHTFLSSFADAAALTQKNEALAGQNAALANENQSLLQKASDLESLLGSSTHAPQGIIAGVIARPPASPYDVLVLSSGARAGVALGQEAFGPGMVPLGVVSSVLDDFSRVTLFSAPSMAVDGWVGEKNLPLTIAGAGAGALRASVPRSASVAVGDSVSVPGPGAQHIATVVRVDSDPSSPLVTLEIQPALNPFSITWVELRSTGPSFAASLSWATSTP